MIKLAFVLPRRHWLAVKHRLRQLLLLIVHAFTLAIYVSATAIPETLNKATIAIVDEDDSPLSKRIAAAFFLPHFQPPKMISLGAIDRGMGSGDFTFVLDIPPNF